MADRVVLSAEASEDEGRMWRKDLDVTFDRRHWAALDRAVGRQVDGASSWLRR